MGGKPQGDHVALTRRIDSWLRSVLVTGSDDVAGEIAVDLADIVHASSEFRNLLERLVAAKLTSSVQADAALQLAADIQVQLFTEINHHLHSLERLWPVVLRRLGEMTEARPEGE